MAEIVRSSASEIRQRARQALSGNWGIAVGTTFVATLLGYNGGSGMNGFTGSIQKIADNKERISSDGVSAFLGSPFLGAAIGTMVIFMAVALIWTLVAFLLSGAITMGYNHFLLHMVRGENPQFSDLFSKFNLFWKSLGLLIVMTVFTALWSLLLVIPGIIAAFRYALAPFLMLENPDMDIMEAISESKRLMQGNKWKLFILHLSFIGWGFLCIFTLFIGLLFLAPYIKVSVACFYQEVKDLNTKSQMIGQIPE